MNNPTRKPCCVKNVPQNVLISTIHHGSRFLLLLVWLNKTFCWLRQLPTLPVCNVRDILLLFVTSTVVPHADLDLSHGETELGRHLDASTPGEVPVAVELLPVPAPDAACKTLVLLMT